MEQEVPTHIKAWGRDREIIWRQTRYYGPHGMFHADRPVWVAEIIVGHFPYASWGVTKGGALNCLEEEVSKLEEKFLEPPSNSTVWHNATKG